MASERILEMILDVRVLAARLDERTSGLIRSQATTDQRIDRIEQDSIVSNQQLQKHTSALAALEERKSTDLLEREARERRKQALAIFQWLGVMVTLTLAAAKVIPEEWIKPIFALVLGK